MRASEGGRGVMTEGRGSALLWFSAFYYLRVVRDFTERIEISRASPLGGDSKDVVARWFEVAPT